MYEFPQETKKIRARIQRYERELRKEHERFGSYDDSAGKRYLLGPLYLLAGDVPGAVRSFEWFERTFSDDIGEPIHCLCWALALYRSGQVAKASHKLRQTMLLNLYLIPHLLGVEQDKLDIWHGTNYAEKDYLRYALPQVFALWDEEALRWARAIYSSPAFRLIRARYIEILQQLKDEPRGAKRTKLVEEAFRLRA